jgi:hypothetical protein
MNEKLQTVVAAADRLPGGRKLAGALAAGLLLLLLAVMLWPGGKPAVYKHGEQCPGKPPSHTVGATVLEGGRMMVVLADCSLKEAPGLPSAGASLGGMAAIHGRPVWSSPQSMMVRRWRLRPYIRTSVEAAASCP